MDNNDIIALNKMEITNICNILNYYNEKKEFLSKQIADLIKKQNASLVITDHARMRYCERVLGIDIKEIDDKLTKDLAVRYKTLGDKTYDMGDFNVIVQNGTIITVTTK